MMTNNTTEMVFILDRSGSMSGLESDTIGGFNAMLAKQRDAEGEALVSTVLFNSASVVIHDREDIRTVQPMTRAQYTPQGNTALLDAVGKAIHHIGNVHKYARREDVPAHTVFVITTDGMENASRQYSREKVRSMIRRQQERYGWEFIFLGANIDAGETAEDLGIQRENAADFICDSHGTELNYNTLDKAIRAMRGGGGALPKQWKQEIDEDYQNRK